MIYSGRGRHQSNETANMYDRCTCILEYSGVQSELQQDHLPALLLVAPAVVLICSMRISLAVACSTHNLLPVLPVWKEAKAAALGDLLLNDVPDQRQQTDLRSVPHIPAFFDRSENVFHLRPHSH